jgi:hypothetical protein
MGTTTMNFDYFIFTPRQQKRHRFQLAEHLEKNVTDEDYDHHTYFNTKRQKGCALGHAAKAGIAGLYLCPIPTFFDTYPVLETEHGQFEAPRSVADIVFGNEAYKNIFNAMLDYSREEIINVLRTWNPEHVQYHSAV